MPSPASSRVRGGTRTTTTTHGFADSPVATCRHPLRGFGARRGLLLPTGSRTTTHGFADYYPRVRGLTRGYMPSPASRVGVTTRLHHAFAAPWGVGLTRDRIPSRPALRISDLSKNC